MNTPPTILPDDETLSVPQAAKLKKVARSTMYLWAVSGRIPARWCAGRLVIRRADLDAFDPFAATPRVA